MARKEKEEQEQAALKIQAIQRGNWLERKKRTRASSSEDSSYTTG